MCRTEKAFYNRTPFFHELSFGMINFVFYCGLKETLS